MMKTTLQSMPSDPGGGISAPGGAGPRSRLLMEELRRVETENITWMSADFPVFWASGRGAWIEDVDGRRYLDATSAFGVASLGHRPPGVEAAIRAQLGRLVHGMGDVHPPAVKVQLLQRLAGIVSVDDPRITLGTGGAMAVEIALKAVLAYTGHPGVLSFHGGYHGLTLGALQVIGHPKFRDPFAALLLDPLPGLPFPDPTEPPPGVRASAVAEHALERARTLLLEHRDRVGGVILEPIQGRGGIRVPAPGFLPALADLCSEQGVLLIADEIFCGLHRTGPRFASDAEGVRPDLLLLGKALGGGMPVGACVGRAPVMEAFGPSGGEAVHTETFLGHPLVMAASIAALDALTRPGLQARVEALGPRLRELLVQAVEPLAERVAAVRGRGAMWGAVLRHPRTGAPDRETVGKIVRAALRCGLILLGGGVSGNVLQIVPPLALGEEDLEALRSRLEAAVREVAAHD